MTGPEPGATAPPVLRIVRGEPSPEELAAVVVALAAAASAGESAGGAAAGAGDASRWAPPERLLRGPAFPTGWWASGLPG